MVQLKIHQSFTRRLVITILFFGILGAAVATRVFSLSIVEHRRFAITAEKQYQSSETLSPKRGTIFAGDKTGSLHPLAVENVFYTLSAVPKNIARPDDVARALANIIPLSAVDIAAKLSKVDDPYEVIARKLDGPTAGKIRDLAIPELVLKDESRRVYPLSTLAASVIGFASWGDVGEVGQYGIEQQYQSYLQGERGFFEGDKDASGYWIALGRRILDPPVDGDSIVLTIDTNIQYKLEQELKDALATWSAPSGDGLVIEPATGRILAMASFPSFDPNSYSREHDYSVFRNAVVDSQFELGSVFKPITMAGGIEAGVITATTTYRDPGAVSLNGYTIRNFDLQAHGVQTMTGVLELSLNTGAIYVEQKLGRARFLDTIQRFGFGEKTGIEFPGEVPGDIAALKAKTTRDVNFATAAFGQGIAITPLQLASAIGAIANHGVLMKPYLVDRILSPSGGVQEFHPKEVRRVVSPETADTISKMLVAVVGSGFDKPAQVAGYFVAGKTGTAYIPAKGGYSDDLIHTFIGYAPAFDPRFLVLLQLNKPVGNRFAANTLTPTFHAIAEFILNYYEVPPDTPVKK